MRNKRTISWSTAMRDLRNERARRAGVREERLRATAGLGNAPALSSWRGRSGRRYVVGIHPLNEADLLNVTEAVLIAVQRDGEGVARVVDMTVAGAQPRDRQCLSWMSSIQARGATEMHVHRLARGEEERRAVIEDLREDA